jgi:hypothetical protein
MVFYNWWEGILFLALLQKNQKELSLRNDS